MQRRVMTYGLMALVCGAFAAACGGDKDDDARRMQVAQGGTGGMGGGTGMGGSTGGVTGGGGAGGAPPTFTASCTQCVELNVPVSPGSLRQAQFLFRPPAPVDMTAATVTWRIKVVTPATEIPADQMYVATFAQNGMLLNYAGVYNAQLPLTAANGFTTPDTWVDVVMNLSAPVTPPPNDADAGDAGGDSGVDAGDAGTAAPVTPPPAGFDITQVFQYGLYVGATAAFAGTGTVRVAVDSVTYTGGTLTDVDFTPGAQGFALDPYMVPPGSSLVHRP